MAKHYVICDNKCLEEAYNKEEIDNLVSSVTTATGTINKDSSGTGHEEAFITYPEGLNHNNCIITSISLKNINDGNVYFFSYDGADLSATLMRDNILAWVGRNGVLWSKGTYTITVYLTKVA